MKLRNASVSALLTAGVLTAAAATAQAQTGTVSGPTLAPISGVDHGVGFAAGPTSDGHGMQVAVGAGAFVINDIAESVDLNDGAGTLVARLPMALNANGRTYHLTPTVDSTAHELTLTSVDFPQANLQNVSSKDRWDAAVQRGAFGALIGAGIGIPVGYFASVVGMIATIPLFALIGFLIAGGPAMADAAVPYFTGQP